MVKCESNEVKVVGYDPQHHNHSRNEMNLIMSAFNWEGDGEREEALSKPSPSHVSTNPNSTTLSHLLANCGPPQCGSVVHINPTEPECDGCVFGNDSLDQLKGTMGGEYGTTTEGWITSEHDELYEVPLSIVVLLSVLYGGISVAALVGNLSVLWIVSVSRRMRTVTNMFIANLALADIIIGLFTIPFQFQAALLQRWNLPDFMCALCPFVQVLSVNISVFTLSAIAVDRYRAVLFPLRARVSKRKAMWVIISIWSVGLFLALPTQIDYKVIYLKDKDEKTKPFCANVGLDQTFRTYYVLGLVVIQYFSPLIIISGAYAHMGTKLWGSTAPGNKEEGRDAIVLRNKKKVIKMLALVVLLFALCWLPLQLYNFLQTLIPTINQYQYINIIWFCSHWLAMSNSCVNPFIYAIYNHNFQREFRTRMCCFRLLCPRNPEDPINCSDGSDFDRTNIRASYRFKNNLSVRYNHQSVYHHNGSPRYQTTGCRRAGNPDRLSPPLSGQGNLSHIPVHPNSHNQQHKIPHGMIKDISESPTRGKCNKGNNNEVGFLASGPEEGPTTPSPVGTKPMAVISVESSGSGGWQCVHGSKTLTVVASPDVVYKL